MHAKTFRVRLASIIVLKISALFCFFPALVSAEEPCIGARDDIILTAFHWNIVKPIVAKSEPTLANEYTGGTEKPGAWYKKLLSQAKAGDLDAFNTIYLPPPWQESQSLKKKIANREVLIGGEGYFYHDYDLNSNYGSKADLVALCAFLKSRNKHIIFDIVPNHRDYRYMEKDIWNYETSKNWRKNNPEGDSGGKFLQGDADLATLEPEVSARITDALNELMRDCNADGWRWDLVWGFSPEQVRDWIHKTPGKEHISIGEYWPGSDSMTDDPLVNRYGPVWSDRIIGWMVDANSAAKDFVLKKHINEGNAEALKQEALIFTPFRNRVVTFVETHDTGSSPETKVSGWGRIAWECPSDFKGRAYAFIICMPGIPSIYYPDYFNYGHKEEINRLIEARRMAGIGSDSKYRFLNHYRGCVAEVLDAHDAPALYFAIDANEYPGPPDSKFSLQISANNYRVWVKKEP